MRRDHGAASGPSTDRRHTHRVKVCGSAVLHGRGLVARCRIADLSTGGISVLPEAEHGDITQLLDMQVQVDIHLDSREGVWISERGVVRYVDVAIGRVGISFESVSPQLEDLVQGEALSEVAAERALRVVVVDMDATRRVRLVAALRRAGATPIEVSTALEAIQAIEQSSAHVAIAAVAESLTQTDGTSLMRYVSVTHPDIQLAVIEGPNGSRREQVPVLHVVAHEEADLDEQVARLMETWRLVHGIAPSRT
jgi:CheY-like chemotaxis protein